MVACEVTQEAGHIRWYCYRCNTGGRIGYRGLDQKAMTKRFFDVLHKNKFHRVLDTNPALPRDCNTEIPKHFNLWLWKYELEFDDLNKNHGVVYSPGLDRLMFPVHDTIIVNPASQGRLFGWAGRSQKEPWNPKTNPKWLTRRMTGIKHLAWSKIGQVKGTVVIVEDIPSAIKVWQAGYNSVALIKSFIPPEMMLRLRQTRVILWLDYDMLTKINRMKNRYRSYGCTIRSITSTMDPKAYTLDKIKEKVEEVRCQ